MDDFFKYIVGCMANMSGVKSMVDIGCAYGSITTSIKNFFPEIDVLGIDISREYIRFCKERWKNCKFKVMDARKLKLKKFDLAFTHGFFIHVNHKDIKKTIKGIMKVSRFGLFIESMGKESKGLKYNPKTYWNYRARYPGKDKYLNKFHYYFKHDYPKLFTELGFHYQVVKEFDEKTRTKMYYVWH